MRFGHAISLALLLWAGSFSALPSEALADLDGSSYTATLSGYRVELTVPKNWQPTNEKSYPSILLRMFRGDPPGTILLSAETLEAGTDAARYAANTVATLKELGFRVRKPQPHATGAYWVDIDSRDAYLRQAFVVAGSLGLVLTLSAPDNRARGQHLRAFDTALRLLRTDPVTESGEGDAVTGGEPEEVDLAPTESPQPAAGSSP